MKKILVAPWLLALASAAPNMAVGQSTLSAGPNLVAVADCTLLSGDVSITLSTGNIGGYACNGDTANIGVAVASSAGNRKIFSIGSSGGALTTTATEAVPSSEQVSLAASLSSGAVPELEMR